MGDPDLFDLLHARIRKDVRLIDEYGNEHDGVTTEAILDLDNIATLFVIVNLIAENGGREITIDDRGIVKRSQQDGRCRVCRCGHSGSSAAMTSSRVRAEGSRRVIGLRSPSRELAEKWGISLPNAG